VKWLDESISESICWCCGEAGTALSSLIFALRKQYLPTEV